ncbi:hypothetical protein CcaverHIS002_0705990 [Cutaneotrichosporon cavernicola]|nr:hypothetical protein CcaverHIS002_0705990 [Cutaneotrichosporon cavernicola]
MTRPGEDDREALLGADLGHERYQRSRVPAWRPVRFRYLQPGAHFSCRFHAVMERPDGGGPGRGCARARQLMKDMKERYPEEDGYQLPRRDNYVALERLATCLEAGTCTDSERKVILLATFHFGNSELGWNGGEQVWARATITAFRELNHTLLFSWRHMDTLLNYQALPELVTHVLWERSEFAICQRRNDTNYREMDKADYLTKPWHDWQTGPKRCMQADDYPQGIPYWKSFQFWFFVETDHPLGGHWILAPENYDMWYRNVNHTYIGYSIEHRCEQFPKFEHREHRGLVLAKTLSYFEEKTNGFFNILRKAREGVRPHSEGGNDVNFDLVTTAGAKGDHIEVLGIDSLGRMNQTEWTEVLARSKLLLGIGRPIVSPSPYYALCMGVPFIQPVSNWDKNYPEDRTKWQTQQMGIRMIEEPYVYHVKVGDEDGLRAAMQRAIDNPIKPYIPPPMTWDAFMGRVQKLLNHDWHAEAKDYVRWKYHNAPEWQYLAMDPPDKVQG